MQQDMHYYGVYALARAAGFLPKVARTIAHSSQFVDDATDDNAILVDDGTRAILPTTTAHKALDVENAIPGDQWKVWVPFHFLPGGGEGDTPFEIRSLCKKNSALSQDTINHALIFEDDALRPYLIGIAAHAYADTFSHHGFVGFSTDLNKVEEDSIELNTESDGILRYLKRKWSIFKARLAGTLAETVPVGHGAVATYPDRPYLKWEFRYEKDHSGGSTQIRDNPSDYTEACELLHGFFGRYVSKYPSSSDGTGGREWSAIKQKVFDIIRFEGTEKERIAMWWEAINKGHLFNPTAEDGLSYYDEKEWKGSHVDLAQREVGLFYKAAWHHRNYVIHSLLPKYGILLVP